MITRHRKVEFGFATGSLAVENSFMNHFVVIERDFSQLFEIVHY